MDESYILRIESMYKKKNNKEKTIWDFLIRNSAIFAEKRLVSQTSHPKSGHKACINAGWDTNQLIS